jgi:hypothetical protein
VVHLFVVAVSGLMVANGEEKERRVEARGRGRGGGRGKPREGVAIEAREETASASQ